ncbi:MAG TPA: universal stress protein [Vicinamibacterales bacterium]|nr:universal stress protein [Vicinamibacterales bacterium]
MSRIANITRVLVGVDFDDASTAALKMAGVLARAWDADMTVFHSAPREVPVYFTPDQIEMLEAERGRDRERTADRIRALAAQHVPRPVRVVVEEGPPQDALRRMAASFDLLVVGTHRRHGARRWWLGSVAEAVVRQSPRPVLVVPAGAIVPEAPRALTILSAGGDLGETDAWAELLKTTFGGHVVRSATLDQCAPDRLRDTDLIVMSTAADRSTQPPSGPIAQVLMECVHPLLFVPSPAEMLERSSS